MSLPYESSTSGERAVAEMQKILQRFGCGQFGVMTDYEKRELSPWKMVCDRLKVIADDNSRLIAALRACGGREPK